eukprot:gene15583-biopygen455
MPSVLSSFRRGDPGEDWAGVDTAGDTSMLLDASMLLECLLGGSCGQPFDFVPLGRDLVLPRQSWCVEVCINRNPVALLAQSTKKCNPAEACKPEEIQPQQPSGRVFTIC